MVPELSAFPSELAEAVSAEEAASDVFEKLEHAFGALQILSRIPTMERPKGYELMVRSRTLRFRALSGEVGRERVRRGAPVLRMADLGGPLPTREEFIRRAPWLFSEYLARDKRAAEAAIARAKAAAGESGSAEASTQTARTTSTTRTTATTQTTQTTAESARPPQRSLGRMMGVEPVAEAAEARDADEPREETSAERRAPTRKKFRVPTSKGSQQAPPQREEKKEEAKESAATKRKALPERLKDCDPELVQRIEHEIMERGETVTFEDVAGLDAAKAAIVEMVIWPMKRPELFRGLRAVPRGMLLFGPPGTGKTMIGRAIASSCSATFFSISASSLMSKWIGESERLVRTLFAVAGYNEPSVVFVDEVDSLLSQRSSDENEASRRIKTQTLVEIEGVDTSKSSERVLVIGATNRPWELDEAARRRFVKRFYVPLPDDQARSVLFRRLLEANDHNLTDTQLEVDLVRATEGFSGADCRNLCQEAAMGPVREVGSLVFEDSSAGEEAIPPITYDHFLAALRVTRPTVDLAELAVYEDWDRQFGTSRSAASGTKADEAPPPPKRPREG